MRAVWDVLNLLEVRDNLTKEVKVDHKDKLVLLGAGLYTNGSTTYRLDNTLVCASESADTPRTWRVKAHGSCLIPGTEDVMTWQIGDHGFEMTLARNVPALINRHLRPWLSTWLDRLGIGLAGVRTWAVHPGGPRILDAVEEALQLRPAEAAVNNGSPA